MNLNKTKYLLYALPALMLGACSKEEPVPGTAGAEGAAQVRADIAGMMASRAHDNAWDAGDRIGISGTTGDVEYINVPYVTTSGDGAFAPYKGVEEGIFFQNNAPATFSAYYPYSADVDADNAEIAANTTDQSKSKSKEFDFLFADGATGSLAHPALNFVGDAAFTHRMTQLVVKVTPDAEAGFDADSALTEGTGTLSGLKSAGKFDTTTGIAEATGEAADWTLNGNVTPTEDGSTLTYVMILFPQEAADGVTYRIEYDGASYSCKLTPALAAGKRYTYNVTLRKTGLTVASSDITDWIDDTDEDIEGGMDEMPVVDITDITESITITKNSILTGTTKSPIHIADGLEIILDNLDINGGRDAGIVCEGDTHVYIKGENKTSIIAGLPGTTLTIDEIDGGKLYAGYIYSDSAAIGAGTDQPCGDIVINGGTFYITPSIDSAQIGSSFKQECGNITINGGSFDFSSEYRSNRPYIGNTLYKSCGDITINGGTFIAEQSYGQSSGAIIGSDFNSTLFNATTGPIRITGGTFNMTSYASPFIGGGDGGTCADIFIEGGTFNFSQIYQATTADLVLGIGAYDRRYTNPYCISVTGGDFNLDCTITESYYHPKVYLFSKQPDPYEPGNIVLDNAEEFPNE